MVEKQTVRRKETNRLGCHQNWLCPSVTSDLLWRAYLGHACVCFTSGHLTGSTGVTEGGWASYSSEGLSLPQFCQKTNLKMNSHWSSFGQWHQSRSWKPDWNCHGNHTVEQGRRPWGREHTSPGHGVRVRRWSAGELDLQRVWTELPFV